MITTDSDTASQTASADDGEGPASDADNPPERSGHPPAAAPRGRDEVQVHARAEGRSRIDTAWLRDCLVAALAHLDRAVRRVDVTVVDDDEMRALNQAHRHVAETTDVLAFECSDPGRPMEADIVVCAGEAARRAAELGHSIERELLLYALHGALHCAGFDDQTENGFAAMHAEEDRILAAIGVGPTFDGDRSRHDDRRGPGIVTGDHAGD